MRVKIYHLTTCLNYISFYSGTFFYSIFQNLNPHRFYSRNSHIIRIVRIAADIIVVHQCFVIRITSRTTQMHGIRHIGIIKIFLIILKTLKGKRTPYRDIRRVFRSKDKVARHILLPRLCSVNRLPSIRFSLFTQGIQVLYLIIRRFFLFASYSLSRLAAVLQQIELKIRPIVVLTLGFVKIIFLSGSLHRSISGFHSCRIIFVLTRNQVSSLRNILHPIIFGSERHVGISFLTTIYPHIKGDTRIHPLQIYCITGSPYQISICIYRYVLQLSAHQKSHTLHTQTHRFTFIRA